MNTKILLLLSFALLLGTVAPAQVKVDLKKKVNREANQRANSNTDKAIDKAFDKLEDGVGSLFKKKKDSGEKETTNKEAEEPKIQKQVAGKEPKTEVSEPVQEESVPAPQLIWAKYDFVPGTEIIFEDNQEGEQNGEFPSKWDLKTGVIENAEFNGSNVIYFRETGNAPNGIVPLIEDSKTDYLPEEFTIEFDAYFEANKYNQSYAVYFYDNKNQKNNQMKWLKTGINEMEYGENKKLYPEAARSNIDKSAKWRHVAISFNKRALKAYLDDVRMINIPNISENPTGISIGAYNHKEGQYFIKNIRIAKGAVPLYDKFLTDGKFVTTGIKFDVNKATIKPESMGTIN
ncbi:MAG: OmpA family protein, partial [Bacteroidia bacterium]|nr:OmpA family protein [Bacteroidia bacterium]